MHNPRRDLPKAVLFSIAFIALVVGYSALAIILAIPDLDAVAEGAVADPVYDTLTTALGAGIAKPVQVMFVIGFLASFLALQTSASRVIWAYARDGALPAAATLVQLRGKARIPVVAILVTTVIGAALFLLSIVAGDIYSLMVNFTAGGFYLAFLFPLVGFLVVLLRRRGSPVRSRYAARRCRWPSSPWCGRCCSSSTSPGRVWLSSSATWTGRCGSVSRCWASSARPCTRA